MTIELNPQDTEGVEGQCRVNGVEVAAGNWWANSTSTEVTEIFGRRTLTKVNFHGWEVTSWDRGKGGYHLVRSTVGVMLVLGLDHQLKSLWVKLSNLILMKPSCSHTFRSLVKDFLFWWNLMTFTHGCVMMVCEDDPSVIHLAWLKWIRKALVDGITESCEGSCWLVEWWECPTLGCLVLHPI